MNLYAHQEAIIKDDPKKCGLFLGTGSGKTLTALLLARGSTLVICPKTIRQDFTWERQWGKLTNPQIKERSLVITVLSKEEFKKAAPSLGHFNTVIVDEAHTCLGVTPNTRQRKKQIIPKASQIYEALYGYIERTKPERLYCLSATIIKSPMTVFAAGKLLGKHWDFYEFRNAFYTKLPMPGREVYAPKRDAATKDRLAKCVQQLGYVGRLQDYFDVPEQSYKVIHVDLTPAQSARIKDVKMEFPDPIVRVGKMHQIENGVLSGDEFSDPEVFENAKIDKILEILLEYPKLCIFAKYRAQIAQIEAVLRQQGIPTLTLTGDTKDRGGVIQAANTMPQGVLIVQAQIGAGFELPDYPCMVFASCTYSFVDRVQAEGRILRANHLKKNLYIDLVVRGGVDESVMECIKNKKDFDEKLYIQT
jgi:superfamily II DNA or RNA helicase